MKAFIDKTFLLDNQTGIHMYHQYCENIPIADYHCRLCAGDIADNKTYENLTEFFIFNNPKRLQTIYTYHKKTPEAASSWTPYDYFAMYIQAIEHSIGSPEYVICHLELDYFFGYSGPVSTKTTEQIWEFCNRKLVYPHMCMQRILTDHHVHYLNVEEELCADLSAYETLKNSPLPETNVTPLVRFDFPDSLQLQALSSLGFTISSYHDYLDAMASRIQAFKSCGCVSLLFSMSFCHSYLQESHELNSQLMFDKLLNEQQLSPLEYAFLQKELLHYILILCRENDLVLMLDIPHDSLPQLAPLLCGQMDENSPKLLLYTDLEQLVKYTPNQQAMSTIFTNNNIQWQYPFPQTMRLLPKIPEIVQNQMLITNLSQCLCSASGAQDFSFLCHLDYYRRHLSNTLGNYIENGYYPKDFTFIETMLENICYHNVIDLFLDL